MTKTEAPDGGRILLVGTPLGNVGDASDRLRAALVEADVVAAEDTRRTLRLARDLGVVIPGRLVSLHDAAEGARAVTLVAAAIDGAVVVVVSDAGMPAVSDPGYRVVRAALDAGVPVGVIPGPSAVLAALVVSGLPVDRFCFEGFLPRKGADRRRRLADLAAEERTMVLFESPRRTAATLVDLAAAFGADRPAALCRELTKTYEEIRRGSLAELAATAGQVRGEVTLVVGGAPRGGRRGGPADWAAEVAAAVAAGEERRAAIAATARDHGVPRREVYDAVVRARAADTAAGESGSRP